MELDLNVVWEKMTRDFTFANLRILEERRFDNVRCYMAQQTLSSKTLYVLDEDQLAPFLHANSGGKYSAIIIGDYTNELPWVAPSLSFLLVLDNRPNLLMEILGYVQELFDALNHWSNTLSNMVGRNYPLDEFLKMGYDIIQNPMLLYDSSYLITATTTHCHIPVEDAAWNRLVTAGFWAPDIRSAVRADRFHTTRNRTSYYDSNLFEHNCTITTFGENGQFFGCLFVQEYFTAISRAKQYLIQFFADILRSEIIGRKKDAETSVSIMDAFFQTMLLEESHSYTQEFVDYSLLQLGWKNNAPYYVLVFHDLFHQQNPNFIPQYVSSVFPQSYSLRLDDQMVTILQADATDFEIVTSKFAILLREAVLKCGISNALSFFTDIGHGYRQAKASLEIGNLLDPHFWHYRYHDYAVEYMLSFAVRENSKELLVHPAVLSLYRIDCETGSHYVSTLEAYFAHSKNLSKLANMLHVHRNTLIYRINRIAEITGIDYTDEKEIKQLYLSIRALHLYEKMNEN